MHDEPAVTGEHAAHAVGSRLREMADAEHERVEDEEAAGDRKDDGSDQEPVASSSHLLAELGAEPFTEETLAAQGERYAHFKPCPFCDGFGAVDPDALLEALPNVVEALAPFPASTVFVRCNECDGWGRVLTGGRLGDNGIQPCPKCSSHGYIDLRTPTGLGPDGGSLLELTPAGPEGDPRDPFTLAPPDGTPPAAGMEWNVDAGRWAYPVRAA